MYREAPTKGTKCSKKGHFFGCQNILLTRKTCVTKKSKMLCRVQKTLKNAAYNTKQKNIAMFEISNRENSNDKMKKVRRCILRFFFFHLVY